MMFSVVISKRAERDVQEIIRYISQDAPENGLRWKQHFHRKAASLESLPLRCGIAPESKHVDEEIRHLLTRGYRILFTAADNGIVTILRVRRSSRLPLSVQELNEVSKNQPERAGIIHKRMMRRREGIDD